MSIEDHIANVDWNRVRKKSSEMNRAKRQLSGLIASILPLFLMSNTNILSQLEQLGPHVQTSSLKTLFNFLLIVYCFVGLYSGFNYFKWSRYSVMQSSTDTPTEEIEK